MEIRGGPLVLASAADVDDIEARLSVPFPDGYREYVTQLGEGALNHFVRVYPPSRVLAELEDHRGRVAAYWFWDPGETMFDQARAMESIQIADTFDGDQIMFHPFDRAWLYILPRHLERVYARGPGLFEAVNWVLSGGPIRRFGSSRYFEPFASRRDPTVMPRGAASTPITAVPRDGLMSEGRPFSAREPRDVLLAYFEELRVIEQWVLDNGGLATQDFDVERSNRVHARYCQPRLARALRGSSVQISSPPAHDPSAIRILEVASPQPDRAVITTAEGFEFVARREYTLSRIGDEWWISSQRDLGYEHRTT